MKTACVYCGKEAATTKDHVPPKALFPRPRPADLLTVPCCRACNEAFSKDDTYLRDTLCLKQELAANPSVSKLRAAVVRSIGGKGRQRYFRHIMSRMSQQEAITPSGLWIGKWPTLSVDMTRLNDSFVRIVKGLFYSHQRTCLDYSYEVRTFPLEYLESLPEDRFRLFSATVIEPLHGQAFVSKGDAVFKYRYLTDPSNPNASAWQLTFYEKYPVFAVTVPADGVNRVSYVNATYPPVWRS